MNNTLRTHDGVVVGIDGSQQGYAAVRYAAGEAQRLGGRFDIVHVVPANLPVAPMMAETSFESHAGEVLARAKEAALAVAPTQEVQTHLRRGRRTQQILEFAEHPRLIVLGSRSPKSFDRIWTGGTVTGVARGADCPVIVVPADAEPDNVHGRMVVGLKSPMDAAELFDIAFPLADQLHAELVVLHAWRLEGVYDDIPERTVVEHWHRELTDLIERALVDYRELFPRVQVRVYVRHEDPAHALVRVTSGADRLLVLCSAHSGRVHHLGRIARAVLRDARCPVELVPVRRGAGPTGSSMLEHSAELVP